MLRTRTFLSAEHDYHFYTDMWIIYGAYQMDWSHYFSHLLATQQCGSVANDHVATEF